MINSLVARKRSFFLLSIALIAVAGSGCNLTGGIDSPSTTEEKLSGAKAELDAGNCDTAVYKIDQIQSTDPAVARLRGWASMCRAGVTISNIGASILSYGTNLTNLDVVGQLANDLVLENPTKINFIQESINSFKSMPATEDTSLNIAIADIALAAATMAQYSASGNSVVKTDISASSCQSVSPCTNAVAGTCPAGMSDADTTTVANALFEANTEIGSNTSLGSLQALVALLGNNSNISAPIERCFIVTEMLSQ